MGNTTVICLYPPRCEQKSHFFSWTPQSPLIKFLDFQFQFHIFVSSSFFFFLNSKRIPLCQMWRYEYKATSRNSLSFHITNTILISCFPILMSHPSFIFLKKARLHVLLTHRDTHNEGKNKILRNPTLLNVEILVRVETHIFFFTTPHTQDSISCFPIPIPYLFSLK